MLCRIGEVEVWRILESNAPFLPATSLFPNAGDTLRDMLDRHAPSQLCRDTGRLILPIQGFLLKTPDHLVLVDACVGNHKTARFAPWHQRSDDRFMAALRAADVSPSDVDFVLCTHLHIDHVGWNTRLEDGRWVPTFPKARYVMTALDEAVFRAEAGDSFRESVLPIIEAGRAELVAPDHQLGDHIHLVPTPGHTPGHVAVLIRSGGAEALITGDALHSTAQCACPHWHFRFDMDPQQAERSRRTVLEDASENRRLLLGSHFTLPSIGHVRAAPNGFRWVAA